MVLGEIGLDPCLGVVAVELMAVICFSFDVVVRAVWFVWISGVELVAVGFIVADGFFRWNWGKSFDGS